MNFSIRATIRDLVAPDHRISCPARLWQSGLAELKRRGRGCRESGAFLLGQQEGGKRRIVQIVYYDDLDPHCLDSGIVIFDGSYYKDLWKICRETGLKVLADVHTHPDLPLQSDADRKNPMIGVAGHVAIVIPNLAMKTVKTHQLGVYAYQGNYAWQSYLGKEAAKFFYIGRWS